jgi:hypothetical protein
LGEYLKTPLETPYWVVQVANTQIPNTQTPNPSPVTGQTQEVIWSVDGRYIPVTWHIRHSMLFEESVNMVIYSNVKRFKESGGFSLVVSDPVRVRLYNGSNDDYAIVREGSIVVTAHEVYGMIEFHCGVAKEGESMVVSSVTLKNVKAVECPTIEEVASMNAMLINKGYLLDQYTPQYIIHVLAILKKLYNVEP